jgi:uroporphyrin-III C-methyltransferase
VNDRDDDSIPSELLEAASEPGPEPAPRPRRRGGGRLLFALVLLAGLGGGGWWLWEYVQSLRASAAVAREQSDLIDALRQQIGELDARIAQNHASQRSLGARLDDMVGTNRALRDEMLAVAERAAALEESVNRLADSRERSATTLRLDEAEYLLRFGQERLELFGDAAGAASAFALADDVLAGIEEPRIAVLRQSVGEELAALRATPAEPRLRVLARLDAIAAAIERLPVREDATATAEGGDASTLRSILGRLVTVRRVDEGGAVIGPARRAAQRAALDLDLATARAAAERSDRAAFRAAIGRVLAQIERGFDVDSLAVRNLLGQVQSLGEESLQAERPALGVSLRELRAVRSLRRSQPAPAAPAPVVEPVPPPETQPRPRPDPRSEAEVEVE